MKTYSKIVVYLIVCEFFDISFSHRLLKHRIPLEKEKEVVEKESPFLLRPYSISKEFWLPFGSFGFKKHVVVKRQAEVTEKTDDLDELTRLPIPGIGTLGTGPIHAEPLPPDTPLIRPIDAPPMTIPVSEAPAPVLPEPVLAPAAAPAPGINTNILPFVTPVKPVEENLVIPVEPPKLEPPPEDFGNYMRRGSQLVLDFGRYLFERMAKLFERARTTFIRPPPAAK